MIDQLQAPCGPPEAGPLTGPPCRSGRRFPPAAEARASVGPGDDLEFARIVLVRQGVHPDTVASNVEGQAEIVVSGAARLGPGGTNADVPARGGLTVDGVVRMGVLGLVGVLDQGDHDVEGQVRDPAGIGAIVQSQGLKTKK